MKAVLELGSGPWYSSETHLGTWAMKSTLNVYKSVPNIKVDIKWASIASN